MVPSKQTAEKVLEAVRGHFTGAALDADTRKLLQKRHSSQVFGMLKNLIK